MTRTIHPAYHDGKRGGATLTIGTWCITVEQTPEEVVQAMVGDYDGE